MALSFKVPTSRLFSVIFLIAFLLRLGYALVQPEEFWDDDERVYLTMAENFLSGDGLVYSPWRKAAFPPLYPLFLAGVASLGWSVFPAVRTVQALVGAGSCLLLAGVSRRAFAGAGELVSRSAGLISAALLALYPLAVFYPARLMTENLFIFLLLAAVLALLQALSSRRTLVWTAAGGVLLGLSALCRPTLLPFVLLAVAWLALTRRGKAGFFARSGVLLAGFVLAILPWQIRNYRVLGALVPITSSAGSNLYIANNPAALGGSMSYRYLIEAGVFHLGQEEDELAYNRRYRARAFDYIGTNPSRFLALSLKRLAWFYHLDYHYRGPVILVVLFHLMLLLALVGIWLSRNSWPAALLPALVILNFTLVHAVFLSEGRYRLPLIPFLLTFAALPLARLLHRSSHTTFVQ